MPAALQVVGVSTAWPMAGRAQLGDLLVKVGKKVVASALAVQEELQAAVDASKATGDAPVITITLLRGGRELSVCAPIVLLGNDGCRRVLCWHGLVLQESPRGLTWLDTVPVGVHIVDTILGSPAEAHGIEGEVLVSVDGVPARSLDDVARFHTERVAQASGCGQKVAPHLRIETADSSGRRFLKTLEPDPLFWPSSEVHQDADGVWHFQESS